MSRMEVLCLKGMYPSDILRRIKGFFAQRLEPFSGYNDLVNLFEDASQLPPVLMRHPRKAGIPVDPGVDDRRPIRELRPETAAPGRQGSYDGCDALIVEIARNLIAWFVERSGGDFEQIGTSLLAHHPVHSGMVIQSHWKELKCDGNEVILVM